MPTYTIDMRNDPAAKAWADGASALAQALTPDYEAQAKGQVMAAQADSAYSRSAANLASRDKTLAEMGLINREADMLAAMDAELAAMGLEDPIERSEVIASFGMQIDPVAAVPNVGKTNLAIAGGRAAQGFEPGSDDYLDRLQTGSGMAESSTIGGFDADMRNENQKFLMEQQGLMARKDPVAVIDPVTNQAVLVPFADAATQQPVLSETDAKGLTRQTGTAPPEAPNTEQWVDGNELVEGFYAPNDARANEYGFVEMSRGPRTGKAGETIQTVGERVFARAFEADLTSALDNGANAGAMIDEVDRTIALLESGVPTGQLTNLFLPWRQVLTEVGIADPEMTAKIEAVTSDLGNRVMARIQDTKGAVSNAEMDYFRKISASVGNTPGGNLMLLRKERQVLERAQRMRNYALTLRNLPDDEAAAALEQWKQANPIFTQEEIAQIAGMEENPETGTGLGDPAIPGGDPELDELLGKWGSQ